MCMCGKPTINGQGLYSWDVKSFSNYPPAPPPMEEGDTLIYDEPGRCGGLDSHSHHFRVVKHYGREYLLVRHGGGNERIAFGVGPGVDALAGMDSTNRYWMLQMIHSMLRNAANDATSQERGRWTAAAVDKRIKVRRRGGRTRVEILPHVVPQTV